MRVSTQFFSILFAIDACACSGSDVSHQPSEPVTSEESPIVNGDKQSSSLFLKYGLVAIYHYSRSIGGWWPRPCSGKIIYSSSSTTYVLTARHCVTIDGSFSGEILTPEELRLLPTIQPGLAQPEPPAAAIQPLQVFPATSSPNLPPQLLTQNDLAIISLSVDWSANAASRQGFFVADPALLPGISTYAYGYGMNVFSSDCSDDPTQTTGSGVARRGGPFSVEAQLKLNGAPVSGYYYKNTNSAGHAVMCGDSGGPDVTTFGNSVAPWGVQLGVHSQGLNNQWSSVPASFVSDFFGGFYLSPYANPNVNVRVVGNTVLMVGSTSASSARLTYQAADKSIHYRFQCMSYGVRSTDSTIGPIMETCSSSLSQRWELNADQRMINLGADGLCLTLVSNRADLAPCTGSPDQDGLQRWAWHVQR